MNQDSSKSPRPRVAITVGDAAGVGPELALRCAADPEVTRQCRPILYGPGDVITQVGRQLGISTCVGVENVGSVDLRSFQPGVWTSATGSASFEAVDKAIDDAVSQRVDAIVTGPIQKEAWNSAGIEFPGHTELLGERTGVTDFCMMLTSKEISCVLATIHIPLADVAKRLTTESVLRAIRLGSRAMSVRFGRQARVTVCGLNPHAGENGVCSYGEESTVIEPAIETAAAEGIDVVGPLPPDTAFTPAIRKRTDVYVCMYHDQGLIPLKAFAFDDAVNVTLGLPIIRTSVDHGTALDLAWQGIANHQSMLAAIQMAVDMIGNESF